MDTPGCLLFSSIYLRHGLNASAWTLWLGSCGQSQSMAQKMPPNLIANPCLIFQYAPGMIQQFLRHHHFGVNTLFRSLSLPCLLQTTTSHLSLLSCERPPQCNCQHFAIYPFSSWGWTLPSTLYSKPVVYTLYHSTYKGIYLLMNWIPSIQHKPMDRDILATIPFLHNRELRSSPLWSVNFIILNSLHASPLCLVRND